MVIEVDLLTPGMILTEDVFLSGGATLLSSSAIITEASINQLKKHNIKRINVEGEAIEEDLEKENNTINDGTDNDGNEANEEQTEENEENVAEVESSFPQITVKIEDDGFSAYLRIEPTGENSQNITVQDLQQVLSENNIIFGADESLLEGAVKKWNETKGIIECENCAKGMPPSPAKEGKLNVMFKHMKNSGDIDKVKKAHYCWELLTASIPIERVDEGTIIAEKELKLPDIPGMNILGEEIKTEEVEKVEIKIGENVEEDSENGSYKSLVSGLVYFVDNTIGVLPVNFNGSAELTISSDNLQANLVIHPPVENGEPPSEDSINALIKEKNICFGLNEKLLSKIIKGIKNGEFPDKPSTIAVGVSPADGEDGKVEYLFRTNTSLKPQINELGSVDFKHVSIIHSVKKGGKVARLKAPTKGKPGMDVFGKEVPCKEGTPANLPAGVNTRIDPEDPSVLISEKEGNVRLNGQVVEVFEGFIIKGDVDFSTGNIKYDKSVVVKGDVKSGFSINCMGDLEVDGTIEDAECIVGGSVFGKYGFTGQGKGIIKCKGNVNLNFMNNQTIHCFGDVNIAREALNCTIYSRGVISVFGKSVSIAGGRLVAYNGINCNVIGNENGVHTTLEVGVDFTILKTLEKDEKDLSELNENRRKFITTFQKLGHLLKIKKTLPEKQNLLFEKLGRAINGFDIKIKEISERMRDMKKRMVEVGNPFIKIEHSAMPGTHFKISGINYVVSKEIIGPKTVRLMNSEICVM